MHDRATAFHSGSPRAKGPVDLDRHAETPVECISRSGDSRGTPKMRLLRVYVRMGRRGYAAAGGRCTRAGHGRDARRRGRVALILLSSTCTLRPCNTAAMVVASIIGPTHMGGKLCWYAQLSIRCPYLCNTGPAESNQTSKYSGTCIYFKLQRAVLPLHARLQGTVQAHATGRRRRQRA